MNPTGRDPSAAPTDEAPAAPREQDAIADRVRALVADALARPLAEVTLDSRLMDDLGAESLDFLDIVFRLEHEFGIQITRGEMERAARGEMTDEQFAPGGVISEAGLARLRELMPEVADRVRPGLRRMQILTLFTVRTFVRTVVGKLEGRSL
jgi:acyl carrier protein